MTKYQKYMNMIHDLGTTNRIKQAAECLTEDITEYLIQNGVKNGSEIIEKIKSFSRNEYNPITK